MHESLAYSCTLVGVSLPSVHTCSSRKPSEKLELAAAVEEAPAEDSPPHLLPRARRVSMMDNETLSILFNFKWSEASWRY